MDVNVLQKAEEQKNVVIENGGGSKVETSGSRFKVVQDEGVDNAEIDKEGVAPSGISI